MMDLPFVADLSEPRYQEIRFSLRSCCASRGMKVLKEKPPSNSKWSGGFLSRINRLSNADQFQSEGQILARKTVVRVQRDLRVGDFDNRHRNRLSARALRL